MPPKEQHTNDLDIPGLYKERLIEPGWAGELNREELAYVKSELKKSPSLKRRWGFRPSARRFSDDHVQAIARDGVCAKKKRVLASVVEPKKPNP